MTMNTNNHTSNMKPPPAPSSTTVGTSKGNNSNSTTNNNNNNNNNNYPRLTTILGAFLETAIHELIYLRSLYPHDAFSPSRYNSIAVHACRHPDVVDYIFDTLNIAVPSIICGLIDKLYLVFYDEESNVVYERYSFEFDVISDMIEDMQYSNNNNISDGRNVQTSVSTKDVGLMIQELERSLRDVLLSIISLDGTDLGRKQGKRNFTDSTTFKICMHTKKLNNNNEDKEKESLNQRQEAYSQRLSTTSSFESCPALKDAIESGKWMRSDPDSYQLQTSSSSNNGIIGHNNTETDCVTITRPLKSMNAPSCGLRMQVMMDFHS